MKEPKKYKEISGWFDFEKLYKAAVEQIEPKEGTVFVEIGAWFGRSTCYMAECIRESGKNIKFDVVDTWEGTQNSKHLTDPYGGCVYDVFIDNMTTAGVIDYITPVKTTSHQAAERYDNETLDFVFIDGDHSYDIVRKDIELWLPKVKKAGTIAGHDYFNAPDVRRAVHELLGDKIITFGSCWVHKK